MAEDLFKVYNVRSVPGKREFIPHHHNDLELAYFKSGRGIYSVTGCDYEIIPGAIFIFSNNEIHKITYVDPSVTMEALNIHFSPRLALGDAAPAAAGPTDLSGLFFSRKEYTNRITPELAGEGYDSIRDALLDCERQSVCGEFGGELLAIQSLIRALVMITRHCDIMLEPSRRVRGQSVAAIADALRFIDRNYASDIRLDALCDIARMSRSNFLRLFVTLAGVTVSEYIRHLRIDHAAELLRATDLTVLDIALASGYHNTANFNKQFKTVMGITPGKYRAAD